MKTNVVLKRQMGDFQVLQRTKDGYFNATSLLQQWNKVMSMKKEVYDYFDLQSTKELIRVVIERENLHTGDYPYVKSKASRGLNAGTWLHPVLFVDFAMWINPQFRYDVLKFVSDQLLYYRNEAGDNYRRMTDAISKIIPKEVLPKCIAEIATALNWTVYNSGNKDLRNQIGEEVKAKELTELEGDIAKFIEKGFISSITQIKDLLRKEWAERWQPKALK